MTEENKYSGMPVPLILIVFFTLLVKFLLLPFAQTVDADAVSRTLLSMQWMEHPRWIITTIWGPFHYYLNGLVLMLWNDPKHALIILHILLSALTLIPFFFFTRREFSEFGAIVATSFLALCPILFRTSFMTLSETPYLLFLALCMNFISKGTNEKKNIYFLLAGLCITLSSGFRYEAWLLLAVFTLLIILQRNWKQAILFALAGCIFPAVYMVQNYLANGHPLFGITGNSDWTLLIMQNNKNVSFENYLSRIWSFPFSWMIALGPLTAFVTIKAMFAAFRKNDAWHSIWLWTIPFWIVLFTMEYNAFKGTLLLHHRFVSTLVVLSLPFSAIYFNTPLIHKVRQAWIFGIVTVTLSFVYNTGNVVPLPRLKDQLAAKVASLVKQNVSKETALIVDNWDWENTYYIALESGLSWDNMLLLDNTQDITASTDEINKVLRSRSNGILVLLKRSQISGKITLKGDELTFGFNSVKYKASTIFSDSTVAVLRYTSL